MEMYSMPVMATYDYKMPNYDGTFRSYLMKVEVLGESAKQYLIKLLTPVNGHRPHDTIRVRKHNVKLHPSDNARYDYSNAFWNK